MRTPMTGLPAPDDAGTIDDVVSTLRKLTAAAIRAESRVGYFAVLYLRMTLGVRQRTAGRNFFADPERMERFDVNFANYYFRSFRNYMNGGAVPEAWKIAFDECSNPKLTVLQHLYLGLCAHQILDLGQAAEETAPGRMLPALRADFEKVNQVVAELMIDMDHAVGRVSPLVGVVDRLASRPWGALNLSIIRTVREQAWHMAVELSNADGPRRVRVIVDRADQRAYTISTRIARPYPGIRTITRLIKSLEKKSISDVIRSLDTGV